MVSSLGMKMVFRLGGAGFALPVNDLIEVNEVSAQALLVSADGAEPGFLGYHQHRGDLIPVRDLGGHLDLPLSFFPGGQITLLVLPGSDAPWGLATEGVEGVFPDAQFRQMAVSEWIYSTRMWPFAQIVLWNNEPLLHCEALALERVWGAQ
jgi:chemotaxis signal transduction protein